MSHNLKYNASLAPDEYVAARTTLATLTSLSLSAISLSADIALDMLTPAKTLVDVYLANRLTYLRAVSQIEVTQTFGIEYHADYGSVYTTTASITGWKILSGTSLNTAVSVILETLSAGNNLQTNSDTISAHTTPALSYTINELMTSAVDYDLGIDWLNAHPENYGYGNSGTYGILFQIVGSKIGINIAQKNHDFQLWKASSSTRYI